MRAYRTRFIIALIVLVSVTSLLIFRLWYLQILKGDEFDKFSRSNRIRFLRVPAQRGRILDRRGRELVINRSSFDVYIDPYEKVDSGQRNIVLGEIVGVSPEEIERKVSESHSKFPFRHVLIHKDVTRDQLALIEARRSTSLRGVNIEVNHVREYPNGPLGSSFLGYLGKATELDIKRSDGVYADDLVGKNGLERSFEYFLRGSHGLIQKVSDALGREVEYSFFQEDLKNIQSTSGADLVLSIDLDLQRVVKRAIGDNIGAVIVVDVNTGEILALVSNPSFNSADFITGIDPKKWRMLKADKSFPLLNRATQGVYAPGSVFKVVTAAAALEEGVITPRTVEYCPGYYESGNSKFRCWKRGGHGHVKLHKAIVQSCDVYFYKTAEKLGIDRLAKYIRAFGIGSPSGIDISERVGLAPSREWKSRVKKRPWYKGDTIVTAIGQGYVSTTPIQVAMMTASIANNGTIYKPHLVKRIISRDGQTVLEYRPNKLGGLGVSEQTLGHLRKALEGAVNEPLGTGRSARLQEVLVAGKTGTAQVVSNALRKDLREHMDHAWFTAYAPSEDAEVAVTVFIEHGGSGGKVAAPIAKKILEYYFGEKKRGDRA